MWYRRMEPQPSSRNGQVWRSLTSYWIGGVLHPAPRDMLGARPWQDRDGEWYWRTVIGAL